MSWESFLSPAVALFNGIMGSSSQSDINAANVAQSEAQRAFSLEMANTAHQREVKDLMAAGLNPILSVNRSGAPMPSYQLPVLSSPYQAGVNASEGVSRGALGWAQAAKANVEQEKVREEVRSAKVAADQAEWVYANFERLLRAQLAEADIKSGFYPGSEGKRPLLAYERDRVEKEVERIAADVAVLAEKKKLVHEETALTMIETVLKKHGVPEAKAFADFFSTELGRAVPYVREAEGVVSSAAKAVGAGSAASVARDVRSRFHRR